MTAKTGWTQTASKTGLYSDPKTNKRYKTLLGKWRCPRCGISTKWLPDIGSYSGKCEHCYEISDKELRDIKNEDREKEKKESKISLKKRMEEYDKKKESEKDNVHLIRKLSAAS